MPDPTGIALVGGRGYVGQSLIRLIQRHPSLDLVCAASRSMAGQPIATLVEGFDSGMTFESLDPAEVLSRGPQVIVLALGNGESETWVDAIDASSAAQDTVVIDVSADHRFDSSWTYGLSEHHAAALRSATRIANPGCYATAMQLALKPLVDDLTGPPACFGVSGFSGAGTRPSPRNDESKLRDNIIPYTLCSHIHEREVSRQLAHEITFSPHVASFFSGISMTVHARLRRATDADTLFNSFTEFYREYELVQVAAPGTIPEVRDNAGKPHGVIGGFSVNADDPTRIALVCTIDNLLKGAASQVVQNINLSQGWASTEGLI